MMTRITSKTTDDERRGRWTVRKDGDGDFPWMVFFWGGNGDGVDGGTFETFKEAWDVALAAATAGEGTLYVA